MGRILENWRVLAAVLFSAVLITGAYMFAHSVKSPQIAQASAESALLQAIATRDSDNDGLADWEEALYGTSPNNSDSLNLGMTDGEAVSGGLIVPKAIADITVATSTTSARSDIDYASYGITAPTEGTITDAFAKNFLVLYATAKEVNGGNDLTSAQTSTLVDQAMSRLSQDFTPTADFKKMEDIKILGSGPSALRTFAIAAEAVLKKNTNDATMSEIEYLQSAVDGDTSALEHLVSLATVYRNSAVGLAVLAVPKELATDYLAIVNSIMRLSGIYADFARINIDPLATILALQQYPQTELSAEQAFTSLAKTYAEEGIVLPNGAPGASFVNVMADIGARQRTAVQNP